jgi:hypothetical protein
VGPDGSWVLNDVPLAFGANPLTLKATSIDGATSSSSITVNRAGSSAVTVTADATAGIGSVPVQFTIAIAGISVKKVEFDFLGGGSRQDVTTFGNRIAVTYNQPGIYSPRVIVTDNDDIEYTSRSVGVLVRSVADMKALLEGVLNGMLDWLQAGDSARALNRVTADNAEDFRPLFDAMIQAGDHLTLANEFGSIRSTVLSENIAEFLLMRTTPDGTEGFQLYLVRGADGIWRLDAM